MYKYANTLKSLFSSSILLNANLLSYADNCVYLTEIQIFMNIILKVMMKLPRMLCTTNRFYAYNDSKL